MFLPGDDAEAKVKVDQEAADAAAVDIDALVLEMRDADQLLDELKKLQLAGRTFTGVCLPTLLVSASSPPLPPELLRLRATN